MDKSEVHPDAKALAEEVDRLYFQGANDRVFAEEIRVFTREGAVHLAKQKKTAEAAGNPAWPADDSLAAKFTLLAALHDTPGVCLPARPRILPPPMDDWEKAVRSRDLGVRALVAACVWAVGATKNEGKQRRNMLGEYLSQVRRHLANYQARAAAMNRRKPKTAAPRTLEQWAACRKTVLAVVFTDIVRSTAMRERLGDEKMDRLLKAHFDIATRVVRRCCGCLVQTGADETLAVFRTASAALCFARKLQSQPGGPNLRIRAGIHVGRISIKGNKPSGQTLNYAKRVMDEAANGGICLSNQAKADIVQEGQHRLSKVKYRAKGNVKLKGIKGKCTVWLVRTKARA